MNTLIKIPQGSCQGSLDQGVIAFEGLAYACAPFGDRRMAPPSPYPKWEGVRDCTKFGPTAPKGPYPPPLDVLLPEIDIPGEECLNLNIWTSQDAQEGSLPVIVWIHGGAFVNGSGSVGVYDGSAFARDGVVCVTLNYRLGADGFLYMNDGIANLGIQDQLFALEWIRDNISYFGGDPSKVTIAGESAGAFSVTTLLSLERSKGLFRGAILQSGAGSHWLTPSTARKISTYLAEKLGIEDTREAFKNVPIGDLIAAYGELSGEVQTSPNPEKFGEVTSNLMIFEPVIDGDIIKAPPLDSIKDGVGSEVVVLLGTNSQEFNLFLVPSGVYDFVNNDLIDLIAGGYGLSPQAVEVYKEKMAGEPAGEIMSKIGTDWFFRIPALRVAEARASHGATTFVYEFRWGSPLFDGKLGACHAVEIPFVFKTTGISKELLDESPPVGLEDEVHSSWVAFVTNLDPSWQPYELPQRDVRIFQTDIQTASDPDGDTRVLWEGVR